VTDRLQGLCFPEKRDCLIEVFVITLMPEAGPQNTCKVIQRRIPMWVTDWPQGLCFPVKHDRLVEVFVITSVLEAG
jgi:hypothetical protein